MKAIVIEQFGPPEVMQLRDVPDLAPGAGQVLVEIKAAGVNPKDAHYREGNYPSLHSPPFTPGIDGAGIIKAIGAGVTHFSLGDRVYITNAISGTYAEFALCNEFHVHLLPASISLSQGAGIGVPYGTAFRAIYQSAKAIPGETLLIHGASGGVGLAALQIARSNQFFIIGTAGTKEGLKLIKNEGVDIAVCHHDPNYLQEIIQLNGGKKIDVILEMQAHLNLGKDLALLAKKGRVVVIGSLGMVEINPQFLKDSDSKILSVSLLLATKEEMTLINSGLQIGLNRGTIRPIISDQIPLKEAARAHQMITKSGHKGKIVLIP